MSDSTWTTDAQVKIVLPSGTTLDKVSVSAADLTTLVSDLGIKKFVVEDGDGNILNQDDFPITSGTVKVKEHNEAKS